ncbi:MAG TPA: N-acetyl-gamma-glutamyl-phosphate reductase [Acidimicrobiia bacterium]|nr:N-acetyl-gamma-glutamyl-phosphate reductase [Acidimicrobiia bacterium]
MHRVAIVGASGYAGAELLRICAGHGEFEVVAATGDSSAGTKISDRYPSLAAVVGDQTFETYSPGIASGTDLTFLALPHGKSQQLVPALRTETKKIVDLSADFRFNSPYPYERWYGKKHESPELLGEFVFGLPELFRESLPGADLVAVAGCYVTTASLALAPLVAEGMIEPKGIIVDAVSGVSGAGRTAAPEMSFSSVDGNFAAYGLLNHRHTPEMEMAIGLHAGTDVQLIFTPHLAPMSRGILATCYAQPVDTVTTADAIDCLASFYDAEDFVTVSDRLPGTKATLGSNSVHLTARVDPRTGWLIAIGALDNLVKGAAGQAIQCANISLGLPEATGLSTAGIHP